jgi:hypothetical protein
MGAPRSVAEVVSSTQLGHRSWYRDRRKQKQPLNSCSELPHKINLSFIVCMCTVLGVINIHYKYCVPFHWRTTGWLVTVILRHSYFLLDSMIVLLYPLSSTSVPLSLSPVNVWNIWVACCT